MKRYFNAGFAGGPLGGTITRHHPSGRESLNLYAIHRVLKTPMYQKAYNPTAHLTYSPASGSTAWFAMLGQARDK